MDPDRLTFRTATSDDLSGIVRLLADDPLGAGRERAEGQLPEAYVAAFAAIEADPGHELLVVDVGSEPEGVLAGVLQLSFLPSLTHTGAWRAQIEGVRVAERWRSAGVGRRLLEEALGRARSRGCRLVQLTTDKRRPDALRFYGGLGFSATHEGLKLSLEP